MFRCSTHFDDLILVASLHPDRTRAGYISEENIDVCRRWVSRSAGLTGAFWTVDVQTKKPKTPFPHLWTQQQLILLHSF